jgi:hypothetical protein
MYHFNEKICAECKGKCCQNFPGTAYPRDIRKNFPAKTLHESVLLALKSKKFAIDWWEQQHKGRKRKYHFYMRPVVLGFEGVWRDPSWGGPCSLFTKEGCSLPRNLRPHGCKTVIPSKDNFCDVKTKENPKLLCIRAWSKVDVDLDHNDFHNGVSRHSFREMAYRLEKALREEMKCKTSTVQSASQTAS